jgi:hypothetical protein
VLLMSDIIAPAVLPSSRAPRFLLFWWATSPVRVSLRLSLQDGRSNCYTDEGYDLVIWGAAEVSITICAASVPLLRVLVREVRNITQRTGARYALGDRDEDKDVSSSFHRKSQGVGASYRSSTVLVTAGPGTDSDGIGPYTNDQWKLLQLHIGRLSGVDHGRGGSEDDTDNVKAMEAAAASAHSRRVSSGRILQTQEVTVQYHARESIDGRETGQDGKMV